MSRDVPLYAQLINLFAAILLLLAFAMLAQRRIAVADPPVRAAGRWRWRCSTAIVAYATGQPHLYCSAALTLRAQGGAAAVAPAPADPRGSTCSWDVETLINIPTTMLVGIVLVVFAFNLALPISQLAQHDRRAARSASRSPACCSSFLMMITRAQGGAAGDRLPGDGERPVLRRDQRDLRHADGGRARHRARRAGRRC